MRGSPAGAPSRPGSGVPLRAAAQVDGRCVAWTSRTGDAGTATIPLDPSAAGAVAYDPALPVGTVRLEVEGLPAGDPEAFVPLRTARGVSVTM